MNERVVVITGASSGIGAALAEVAVKKGASVVLAARREKELGEVAAKLGAKALPVVADVTRRRDVERILETAVSKFGRIDVWVNNAGRGITRPVSELGDEELDAMVAANLKSALYGMQVALKFFQSAGGGRGQIINVSSMLGKIPYVHFRSAYSAMKAALNSLAGSLRLEIAQQFPNIVITTVSPGVVVTDFGKNALGGGPDSRSLPYSQSAPEVAEIIWEAIENPQSEVYTRPQFKQQVVEHHSA